MRVLITGAGGLIGGALARHFATSCESVPLLHRDLDITDPQQVERTIRSYAPDLLINAAAVGVDECERNPELARAINEEAPARLARSASGIGASFVHFSTNYVFSGERNDRGFYEPDDEAVPINTYGRTKLAGEQLVLSECPRASVIRTSWVFGEGKGSFLATLPNELREGRKVAAITDRFASVTYVDDLVLQLARLIELGARGVFHLNNAGVCSYAEFAEETAERLGLTPAERADQIAFRCAPSVAGAASRPRWTPMRCDRSAAVGLPEMRRWQEALAAYVASLE